VNKAGAREDNRFLENYEQGSPIDVDVRWKGLKDAAGRQHRGHEDWWKVWDYKDVYKKLILYSPEGGKIEGERGHFTGHSFRRGLVREALNMGIGLNEVQGMTHHRSLQSLEPYRFGATPGLGLAKLLLAKNRVGTGEGKDGEAEQREEVLEEVGVAEGDLAEGDTGPILLRADEEDNVFVVSKVLDIRFEDGVEEGLVKWLGYNERDWVPTAELEVTAKNLLKARRKIREREEEEREEERWVAEEKVRNRLAREERGKRF
jgi:hypothetical protein